MYGRLPFVQTYHLPLKMAIRFSAVLKKPVSTPMPICSYNPIIAWHYQLTATVHNVFLTQVREDKTYRKKIIRKLNLPKFVDPKMMRCEMSEHGIVTVEMPFHLPPVKKPEGPNVYPIVTDADGRRKICLAFSVGLNFTSDNITVDTDGQRLSIRASRAAIFDEYGQVTPGPDLKKEFILPDYIEVDNVSHVFTDGKLTIDVFLKDEKEKCEEPREETTSW